MTSRTRDDVISFMYISNSYSLVIKVRDVVRIRIDKVVSTESHSTNFMVYWCTFAFVGRANLSQSIFSTSKIDYVIEVIS